MYPRGTCLRLTYFDFKNRLGGYIWENFFSVLNKVPTGIFPLVILLTFNFCISGETRRIGVSARKHCHNESRTGFAGLSLCLLPCPCACFCLNFDNALSHALLVLHTVNGQGLFLIVVVLQFFVFFLSVAEFILPLTIIQPPMMSASSSSSSLSSA